MDANETQAWEDAASALTQGQAILGEIFGAIGTIVAIGFQIVIVLVICGAFGLIFKAWRYVFRG